MWIKTIIILAISLLAVYAAPQDIKKDNQFDIGSIEFKEQIFYRTTDEFVLDDSSNVIFKCKSQFFETCLVEAILDLKERVEKLEAAESANDN